jgi:hypothetical protein
VVSSRRPVELADSLLAARDAARTAAGADTRPRTGAADLA